jgi:hypothetical protein
MYTGRRAGRPLTIQKLSESENEDSGIDRWNLIGKEYCL